MDTSFIESLKERDPAKAGKFAALTLEDLRARLVVIQNCVAVNNNDEAAGAAHAMKSVAAQAGAANFSELCKLIELRCKGEGDLALSELLLNLQNEFHKIEQVLSEYLTG